MISSGWHDLNPLISVGRDAATNTPDAIVHSLAAGSKPLALVPALLDTQTQATQLVLSNVVSSQSTCGISEEVQLLKITTLSPYSDERGNRIETDGEFTCHTAIFMRGTNNLLRIRKGAKLTALTGSFDGDSGLLEIGPNPETGPANWNFRVGERSRIVIGSNVTTTNTCVVSAVEGTEVIIGDGCMIAANCDIRADDGHAIYDVETGARVNTSANIHLVEKVWLGYGSTVLSGVTIESGTVVGAKSVVTRSLPNNVIAVGSPAKIVRMNIAWERPHLSMTQPPFRPDATVIKKRGAWALTRLDAAESQDGKKPGPWQKALNKLRSV